MSAGGANLDDCPARLSVFGDIRQALRDQVIGGRLQLGSEPATGIDGQLDLDRASFGERLYGGGDAFVGQDRWVDPASQLP